MNHLELGMAQRRELGLYGFLEGARILIQICHTD